MKYLFFTLSLGLVLFSCKPKQDKVSTDLINITPSEANSVDPDALPVMVFDTTWIEYGIVTEGAIVRKTFKFKNTGEAPLVISRVEPSCGCTTAKDWKTAPYAPGESGEISIEFDTNGRPGIQKKSIQVIANTVPALTLLYLAGEVAGPENQ